MGFCNIEDVLTYLPHWIEIRHDTTPNISQVNARIEGISSKIRKIIGSLQYNPEDVYLKDLTAKGSAGWVLATAEMRTDGQIQYVNRLLKEYENEMKDFEKNLIKYLEEGLAGGVRGDRGRNTVNGYDPIFNNSEVF